MSADRVLIAFSSQQGSTAGVAETIAMELRDAGFVVDCLPVAAVTDLEPYGAVVLGSGVFLAGRRCDGGGFISRHAQQLQRTPVWLFSAGPIGGTSGEAGHPAQEEAPVVRVARAIGARGAATFGAGRLWATDAVRRPTAADWGEAARVRGWAWSIAVELARAGIGNASPASQPKPARPLARWTSERPAVVTR